MPRLIVRQGTEPGKVVALPEAGEIKIGRLPGLAVTLADAKVSREHCRLFKQATGWICEDLNSRNGVYVNSQRVKKRLLQQGDRLRIGQTEFEYSTAAADAPADAPAAAPPAAGAAPAPVLRPGKSARDRL